MRKTNFLALLVSVSFIIILCSGCANKVSIVKTDSADSGTAALEGNIRVSGAFALYPMMVKWAEEFSKLHPNVKIDVSAGGAGKGASDALSGLVDIGMISREIAPEEIEKGAYFVPVVKDAVFIGINKENPVAGVLVQTGLKKKDFARIWMNDSELTWGEVAGTDDSTKVNVYTRSDSCGAADTWAKYLGGKQEDLKGIAVYADPGIAEAVKKDANGIGYNNLNYGFDSSTGLPVDGLVIVPIDVDENGTVDPEEDVSTKEKAIKAIYANVYPSPPARNLFLMAKGNFTGVTLEFVKWILNDGQTFVDEVGYIKLTDSELADAKSKV